MTPAWVIGAGGLLGRAVVARLVAGGRHQLYAPDEPLLWNNGTRLRAQLTLATQQFVALAARARGTQACIYWAAGIGTLDSRAQDLQSETLALQALLGALALQAGQLGGQRIHLCLSSSAGAMHAGAADGRPVTERSVPTPTTPYGHEKLRQEVLARQAAHQVPQLAVTVLRMSTLYGPRGPQGPDKGLVQHIASSLRLRAAVHVYVPLDTLRDYITAGDAAARMIAASQHPPACPERVGLVASGVSTSIGEVVQLFRRIGGRKPLVVTGAHWKHALYSPCLRFQPSAWLEAHCRPARTMALGIAEVLAQGGR